MDLSPKYDNSKPWWKNRGCMMRFQLDNNIGIVTGVPFRIDENEYRKYVVVNVNGNFVHINIDHIIKVEPIIEDK